jgi:hypothetical protein
MRKAASVGQGFGELPELLSVDMNFFAMLIPIRIICNWFA